MRNAAPAGNDLESDPTVDARSVGRPVTRLRLSGWLLLACAAFGCSESPVSAPATLTAPSDAASLRAAYVSAVQRDADPSYAAVTVRPGTLRVESAAQQLTAHLDRQRVQVTHRSGGGVDLTLASFGCATAPIPARQALPVAKGNRIEYNRPGLREWYVNGPLGLEQGFVVDAPAHQASCGGQLVLRLGLAGSLRPSLSADRSSLDLRSESGQPVLRYQDLYAQDATGRALPTGLALVGSQLELWIDDAAATYPITVDPLLRWVEQQKLIASDAAASSYLGGSAAISGDTAILGASGLTVMGKAYAGGAYVFVRSGTTWTEQAKLTTTDAASNAIGDAVALSGDTAVLGARFVDVAGKVYAGAAYVFVRSGTTWTQQAKLVHPTSTAFDYFGSSVAVSGDTLLVGSPRTDSLGLSDSGVVLVFARAGTTWTKQAELLAGDIRSQGQFGSSVALDGNEAVIGAPWQWASGFSPRSGEVYVFSRSGTTWTQTASLQAADGATDDYLGTSVAFFGNLLVAGAPGVDLPAAKTAAGAAYLFARSGSTWTQAAKLTAPDAAQNDGFGTTVSAASDTVAIAAPGADLPSKTEAGAVYLFASGAGSWALRTKLVASDAAAAQSFGDGLSLSDDTLVVGASGSVIAGKTAAGAGYVYAAVAAKTDGTACGDASECQSGFCVDGVCCSSACGGGDAGDCQACAVAKGAVRDGTCAPVKAGTGCRIAVGLCDDAEVCDGTATACPANRVKAAGTVCRPAGGDCDVAEVCDGTASTCPTDQVKSIGTICRPKAGECDTAESCSGLPFIKTCPADVVLSAGSVCRPSAGVCDVAESCTGTTADCPTDRFKPTTTECRTAVEACDAPEFCSGSAAACPADVAKPATALCRPAIGDCDAPEFCTGTTKSCPMDQLASSTTVCRPAASACDVPETCSGVSIVCPPDVQGMCKMEADLSVTLSASPVQLAANGDTTLAVLVRNSGPLAATGVVLRLDLPSGVQFVRGDGDKWTCGYSDASSVGCVRLELPSGQSDTVQLLLRVTPPSSQFGLTVTARSAQTDPVPANNSGSVTITTLPASTGGPDAGTGGSDAAGCSLPASARSTSAASPLVVLLLSALTLAGRRRRAWRACDRSGRSPTALV